MRRDENIILLENLVIGQKYRGKGRNFNEGVWTGVGFKGMRKKFAMVFEDIEYHYDTDPFYGTFQPLEIVEE